MFRASDYTDVLHLIEDFLAHSTPADPVSENVSATDLRDRLAISFPSQGKPLSAINKEVALYFKHAVRTAHPAYFNQLWGGFSPASFIADMITSAANTSMYTHEVAPIATQIEKALVAKMGELVGFENPGGQFTTGGSNGNLMAMAMARHRAAPQTKETGSQPQLAAFVSQEAHYSFLKAAQLLGIGAENLWKVPVDELGQLQLDELKRMIAQAREQGALPFLVVGTAGTTVRGAYDPLAEISAIARAENLWFHVDGAWGGGALLSSKHRPMMHGVEQADSVVWDAHKMMGMTLVCSVLLTKRRDIMHSTFSAVDTDYLFHDDEEAPTDLGPSTMHCGRRVDAVKLWLAWQHLGDRGWEETVNRYFELAERAEAIIRAHDSLEMVFPRQSLNLCFRYVPDDGDQDRNALTLKIRQRLLDKGKAMVNYATLREMTFFRLVLCNNQTKVANVEQFFADVVEIGKEIESETHLASGAWAEESQVEKQEAAEKQTGKTPCLGKGRG